jgi:hypothetical protein
MVPVVNIYASGGLSLNMGASSITPGETASFSVSLPEADEEGYTLSVNVSPSASLSSSDVSTSGSSCTVSSKDLDGMSSLSFTVSPGEVTEETTYTVSVTAGSDSDSGSFTVSPAVQEEEESEGETGGEESASSRESGQTGQSNENSQDKQNSQDDNQMSGGKMPSGKGMKKGNMPSGGSAGSVAGASGASGASVGGSNSGSATAGSSSTTYQGSEDNYLKKLMVKGYSFTQTFDKTCDTYFLTAEKGTRKLKVKAKAQDDDATVVISGAKKLKSGRNKILITVTSESGTVRTYRIYADVA